MVAYTWNPSAGAAEAVCPWIPLTSQSTPVSKFQFLERAHLSSIKLRTIEENALVSLLPPLVYTEESASQCSEEEPL